MSHADVVRGALLAVEDERTRALGLHAFDLVTTWRDDLYDALREARSYIEHLLGDEGHFDEDGEPYHDGDCDTCREIRLIRMIDKALRGV